MGTDPTPPLPGYSHEEVYARYKEQVPENIDFTAPRNERVFPMPTFLKRLASPLLERPEQEMICLELMFNVTVVVIPAMVFNWMCPLLVKWRMGEAFYANNWGWIVFGGLALYVCLVLLFMQRFVLTLHVTAHRRLFKMEYNWLNSYNELVLAPFFGIPPGFYHLHHICMHHVENNVFPYDITSTMPHQRDSWLDLLSYIRRYLTHSFFYLPYYAFIKRRYRLAAYALAMLSSFTVGSYASYCVNPLGTWVTIIIPYLLTAVLLMQGNFAQHMFITPECPFDNFGLAFNTCNAPMNQLTYNDGYHIIHHLNSRLHWSDVPKYFEDNIEKFAEKDSLVFQQLENGDVWAMVFFGRYEALYKYWVQLTPQRRSVAEFEALLKSRMKPMPSGSCSKKAQ